VVKPASLYLVIPAGSAGIPCQGWQKQWRLESLGRAPCHFAFNHYRFSISVSCKRRRSSDKRARGEKQSRSNSQIEWKVTDIAQAVALNHRIQYFQLILTASDRSACRTQFR